MDCLKRRSIFDLFRVYSCKACVHNKVDEYMLIGYNSISIHYFLNTCPHLKGEIGEFSYSSLKLEKLLHRLICEVELSFIVWINEEESGYLNYEIFDTVLEEDYNIEIIVY